MKKRLDDSRVYPINTNPYTVMVFLSLSTIPQAIRRPKPYQPMPRAGAHPAFIQSGCSAIIASIALRALKLHVLFRSRLRRSVHPAPGSTCLHESRPNCSTFPRPRAARREERPGPAENRGLGAAGIWPHRAANNQPRPGHPSRSQATHARPDSRQASTSPKLPTIQSSVSSDL